jgi:uncharacterized protein YoxC
MKVNFRKNKATMAPSVKTFLHQHPESKIKSLRYICKELNLETEDCRVKEDFRSKIVEFVGDNNDYSVVIKLAEKFKNNQIETEKGRENSEASIPLQKFSDGTQKIIGKEDENPMATTALFPMQRLEETNSEQSVSTSEVAKNMDLQTNAENLVSEVSQKGIEKEATTETIPIDLNETNHGFPITKASDILKEIIENQDLQDLDTSDQSFESLDANDSMSLVWDDNETCERYGDALDKSLNVITRKVKSLLDRGKKLQEWSEPCSQKLFNVTYPSTPGEGEEWEGPKQKNCGHGEEEEQLEMEPKYDEIMEFSQHLEKEELGSSGEEDDAVKIKTRFQKIVKEKEKIHRQTVHRLIQAKKENAQMKREMKTVKPNSKTEDHQCCKDVEARLQYMVSQSIDIVASKDLEISLLQDDTQTKIGQIEKLEAAVKHVKDLTKNLMGAMQKILTSNESQARQMEKNIEETVKRENKLQHEEVMNHGDKCLDKLLQINSRIDSIDKKLEKPPTQIPKTLHANSENSLNQCNETSPKTSAPIPQQRSNDGIVLIVGDSNKDRFDARRLHDKKEVRISTCYSTENLKQQSLECDRPSDVTDVVFLTGLNDSKQAKNSVIKIIENQEEAIKKYRSTFPNAQLHVGDVAPVSQKQQILNAHLKNLAHREGASHISTQGMYDRETGNLRSGMLNGYHYTEAGVKIMAKEIKRSLYRYAKRQTTWQPTWQNRNSENIAYPENAQINNVPQDQFHNNFSQTPSAVHSFGATFLPTASLNNHIAEKQMTSSQATNPMTEMCDLIGSMKSFFDRATERCSQI